MVLKLLGVDRGFTNDTVLYGAGGSVNQRGIFAF
jgi:hypothetical protein